jgi:hypothetical protein
VGQLGQVGHHLGERERGGNRGPGLGVGHRHQLRAHLERLGDHGLG